MSQNKQKYNYDAIIIGGGAAGLMCAARLGQQGLTTLILDHANKVGKKILMSGGGRCNFTNYSIEPKNYLSENPHFCKSALSRYTQWHFLDLINKYEIPFHEKTKGQLFCDNKAKDILNMLLDECAKAKVTIETSTSVHKVTAIAKTQTSGFTLETSLGAITTDTLVVATGGLSIPTMGATGFGYELAQDFGLKITPRHASLVPFTLNGSILKLAQDLAGLSILVDIQTNDMLFQDQMLFTHKGLSGPAILQISNYWWPDNPITLNMLPEHNIATLIQQAQIHNNKKSIQTILSEYLPKRFVQAWLRLTPATNLLTERTAKQLQPPDIEILCTHFHRWTFKPKGTEGYKTAEVTRGGISTAEVSSKTFESKKQPGLYFIGEVLDVTGWLGGFNFQWAWASGWCAANAIAETYQQLS